MTTINKYGNTLLGADTSDADYMGMGITKNQAMMGAAAIGGLFFLIILKKKRKKKSKLIATAKVPAKQSSQRDHAIKIYKIRA